MPSTSSFSRRSAVTSLPVPDPDTLRHSAALTSLITEQIAQAGGRLPFDRYMELALYAPGLGYYSAGSRKLGAAGDFVTAPEHAPLFSQLLARQAAQVLDALQGGEILEFGAGSGVLAVDMLLELARLGALPKHYFIVEVSAELKARQRALVQQRLPESIAARVRWLDALPEPGFRGLMLANEVVDAMPVHRFRLHEGNLQEQYVGQGQAGLQLVWGAPSESLAVGVEQLAESSEMPYLDYESEINLRAAPWLGAVAERLAAGLFLLIDYGYPRSEFYLPERNRGTLMCHYRHRAHADPLRYPGLQDITAHVDFTALADAALASGLRVCGYTTQAFFLFGCGLQALVAASDPDRVREHLKLMQEVKRLTMPSEMGERFKVLGLCREMPQLPIGFSKQDLRGRL